MTGPEFAAWAAFYALHPFDDASLYHRPAALVAACAGGAEVSDLLNWLDRVPDPYAGFSDADRATMKAFGRKPPARS